MDIHGKGLWDLLCLLHPLLFFFSFKNHFPIYFPPNHARATARVLNGFQSQGLGFKFGLTPLLAVGYSAYYHFLSASISYL